MGLVPVGRDRDSGLWEFAHLRTGEIPERDDRGKLFLREETALVFVLIPGGTFRMGAVKAAGKPGPNIDPDAEPGEGPVHEVSLEPFLISKYEMTQGQWLRFTGENPSAYKAGAGRSTLHPVEKVSRERCREILRRLGLELPTEAQWEYCARGGTSTVWWTGDSRESIRGAGNVLDVSWARKKDNPADHDDWLDDGHERHAPVGNFHPNPFGLHDTIGNVWEWVRDGSASYDNPVRSGNGLRQVPGGVEGVIRGGSWNSQSYSARSANRYGYPGSNEDGDLGVRPLFPLQKK